MITEASRPHNDQEDLTTFDPNDILGSDGYEEIKDNLSVFGPRSLVKSIIRARAEGPAVLALLLAEAAQEVAFEQHDAAQGQGSKAEIKAWSKAITDISAQGTYAGNAAIQGLNSYRTR